MTHYLHAARHSMKLLFVNDTIVVDIHNIYQAVMRGLRPRKLEQRSIQHGMGWGCGDRRAGAVSLDPSLCHQGKAKCCQVPAQEMLVLGVSVSQQLLTYSDAMWFLM